jgi:glycosyltransferase involved in cell wall biosynthesis
VKVAIVNTHVPFVRGGAEVLASGLAQHLREHGHQVELIRLPFRWYPPQKVLDHMLAARLTRIDGVDRVIGLKFPAYLVPHEDKVMWILHQHRQVYDLWGTPEQDPQDTPDGRSIRQAIIDADNRFLPEARGLFAISQVSANRMRAFNGLHAQVLYPPLPAHGDYHTAPPSDYLFFPSRIAGNKRQALAAAAMRHVRSDVRLIIAGQADFAWALDPVREAAADPAVRQRIEIREGWLPEQDKLELLANCLGVLFPPSDEDYGYITLEAFLSGKPVITCTDSGGPLEFVQDGISGYVAEPEPDAIAEAIDRLAADRSRARAMGEAGRERVRELDISWEHVVAALTA